MGEAKSIAESRGLNDTIRLPFHLLVLLSCVATLQGGSTNSFGPQSERAQSSLPLTPPHFCQSTESTLTSLLRSHNHL